VGFAAGLAVERLRERGAPSARGPVVFALVVLLGLLAYFKYADFVFELLSPVFGAREPTDIVLPLAISFYTFQILAYVIDVYRGTPAERSPLRFGVFVGFFPQLIAGPIVRARQLLPQLERRARFDADRVLSGLQLLAYGVVKKTVFADNLAFYVDRVYADPARFGGVDVVVATLAFGAQIYCDFSGYTDIARGSARLLGIELPVNFRSPYTAGSVGDFWRRWHITLSTWLRDYLYVPLGGNRLGRPRLYANLLFTMLLGGLWHGASITFVLWGAYHAVLLVVERALGLGRPGAQWRVLGAAITFVLVQIGWAFFRAGDLATLAAVATSLIEEPLTWRYWSGTTDYAALVVLAYALHALSAWVRAQEWTPRLLASPAVAVLSLAASILLVVVFGGSSEAFIYFQF
jgi:D-alanyl-lipoteichoic acid acyltransferase DltB (MBOAT superfamily)